MPGDELGRRIDGLGTVGGARRGLAGDGGQPSRSCQGCRVGDVLLLAPVEQVLADVEDEGRDGEDSDETEGEDRERLAAFAVPPISG